VGKVRDHDLADFNHAHRPCRYPRVSTNSRNDTSVDHHAASPDLPFRRRRLIANETLESALP